MDDNRIDERAIIDVVSDDDYSETDGGPLETYTVEEGDEQLVRYIEALKTEYEQSEYRQTYFDEEVDMARKAYRQDVDPKNFPWDGCSNKKIPLTTIAVDHLEPRIVGMLFADSGFVGVKPVGEEDIAKTERVKEELEWLCSNEIEWEETARQSVHDCLIDGTVFLMPLFETKKVIRRQRVVVTPDRIKSHLEGLIEIEDEEAVTDLKFVTAHPSFPNNVPEDVLAEVPDYEEVEEDMTQIKITKIELKDIFCPDSFDDFREAPTLRRITFDYHDLLAQTEENGGPYYNVDDSLVTTESAAQTDTETKQSAAEEQLGARGSEERHVVEAIEAHIKYDLKDGNGHDWCIVTIAEQGGRIIRKQRLVEVYFANQKPIVRIPCIQDGRMAFGHGIHFLLRHLESGVTDLFNQMIDSGTIQIIPWFFYEQGSGYDPDEMTIAPGMGIPVLSADKIKFPTLNPSARMYLEFIEFLLAMMERILSLSDFGMGRESEISGRGGQTATGIQIITQQGEIQHSYRGRRIQQCFNWLLKQVYLLHAQTISEKKKRRIWHSGDDQWQFEPVDITAIVGNFDFEITLAPNEANQFMKQRKAHEFLQVISPIANMFNPIKLAEEVCRAWEKKPYQEWLDPEVRKVIQGHFEQKKKAMEQKKMVAKEERGVARRTIHNKSDMSGPGTDLRVKEIEKQVHEAQIKKNIRDQHYPDEGAR